MRTTESFIHVSPATSAFCSLPQVIQALMSKTESSSSQGAAAVAELGKLQVRPCSCVLRECVLRVTQRVLDVMHAARAGGASCTCGSV